MDHEEFFIDRIRSFVSFTDSNRKARGLLVPRAFFEGFDEGEPLRFLAQL